MGEAGVTNALCVNQEVGNAALDERCRGFTDGLGETGGTVEVLEVDLNNPTEAQSAHRGRCQRGRRRSTASSRWARPVLRRRSMRFAAADKLETISLATFDLSPEVLEAIDAGEMLFAIDQQQYLQGYLPIVLLTLNVTNLNTVANPVLMTGPGFVTQENAARVIELSAAGTR